MSLTPDTQNNSVEEVNDLAANHETVAQNKSKSDAPVGKVNLVAVGVRTAFVTIIAIVLLFGCFLSFFPYSAMKFYDKVGNKEMALAYAEKYMNINRSDDSPSAFGKYADALYYAANTSAYFMNKYNDSNGTSGEDVKYFAEKTYKYATEYLSYKSLAERTEKIDNYNISHAMPVARPQVFSYSDYLNTMLFKSQYILYRSALNGGDVKAASEYRKEMLDTVQGVITSWNEASNFELNEKEYDNSFLMFSQLTTYINGELYELGLKSRIIEATRKSNGVLLLTQNDDNGIIGAVRNSFDMFIEPDGTFTAEYTDITLRYNEFINRLRDNCIKYTVGSVENNAPTMHLKNTANLKAVVDFTVAMNNMTAVLSTNAVHYEESNKDSLQKSNEDWRANLLVSNVRVDGNDHASMVDIFVWYENGYLADYLDYFKK